MRAHSTLLSASLLVAIAAVGFACGKSRTPTTTTQAGQGLAITISGANVTNGHIVVQYRVTDRAGNGRTDLTNVENRWTAAALSTDPVSGLPAYKSFVLTGQDIPATSTKQPNFESNGSNVDKGSGNFEYTFANAVPSDYNAAETVRVGVFSRLNSGTSAAPVYDPDQPNVVFDFVPAGGTPQTRELVNAQNCNVCHGEVRAHGGFRRGTQICLTCHTFQNADPDTKDPADPSATAPNPVDFGRLVHRIHRGKNLPTLYDNTTTPPTPVNGRKYSIIGFNSTELVFGEVTTRTDNGVSPGKVVAEGVGFPQDLRNCAACHANATATGTGNTFQTATARRTCQGCHANILFDVATSPDVFHKTHPAPGGIQTSDAGCIGCHPATGTGALGHSIAEAHQVPFLAAGFNKPTLQIVSVTNPLGAGLAAGQKPTVVFKVTNTSGGSPPTLNDPTNGFSSISILLAGPTNPDYSSPGNVNLRESPPGTLTPDSSGNFTYTFVTNAVPTNSTGTWAVGMQGRRSRSNFPLTGQTTIEAADNPVSYFDLAGGTATPRRTVVDRSNCNNCHLDFSAHGGSRRNTEYCVMCHAPDQTDWGNRPKTGTPPNVNVAGTFDNLEERSVHFKQFIHKLHTGKRNDTTAAPWVGLELSKPYVVYGSPNFFDDIRFPHDQGKCTLCHTGETYRPESIPAGASPTLANETSTVMHAGTAAHVAGEPSTLPIQSACIGCHNTTHTKTHADTQGTVGGVEQCTTCHGAGQIQDVKVVHTGLGG